jgi:hypothetical protein
MSAALTPFLRWARNRLYLHLEAPECRNLNIYMVDKLIELYTSTIFSQEIAT